MGDPTVPFVGRFLRASVPTLGVVLAVVVTAILGRIWWREQVRKAADVQVQMDQAQAAADTARARLDSVSQVLAAAADSSKAQQARARAAADSAKIARQRAARSKERADSLAQVVAGLLADTTADSALGAPEQAERWKARFRAVQSENVALRAVLTDKTAEAEALGRALAESEARAGRLDAALTFARFQVDSIGRDNVATRLRLAEAMAQVNRGCRVNLGLVKPSCGTVIAAVAIASYAAAK